MTKRTVASAPSLPFSRRVTEYTLPSGKLLLTIGFLFGINGDGMEVSSPLNVVQNSS